jgi:hypothetical protein
MTKKEIIWREILYRAIEKKQNRFTQKDLAKKFGFSLSTVFNALKIPRESKAIRVTGRYFEVTNPEKFLYLWATFRNLEKDIVYQTHFEEPIKEIESQVPSSTIFGAYSAFIRKFKEAPADYDKIYLYAGDSDEIKKRFPEKKGYQNLIVLKADPFLKNYGSCTPVAQLFVDLFNLPEWYATDFLKSLKEKLSGILA